MGINLPKHIQATENVIKHSLNNVSESLSELNQRISFESSLKGKFEINYKIDNYHFDFYAPSLKLGIQVDAFSFSYSDIFNTEKVKLLSISHKNIRVLKISDYQILADCDEVIRFLKNYIKENKKIISAQKLA